MKGKDDKDKKLAVFGFIPLIKYKSKPLKKKCQHIWQFYKADLYRTHTEKCLRCDKTKVVKK
jgi:hypothetical protein